MEGAYYAEGFDAASIGFEVAEKKKGEREVKILVEEGPQTLVSEVVVRGVSDEHAAAVRDALDVEPGAPLSAPAIRLLVSGPVSSTRPSAKLWMTPRGPNFLRNLG